MIAYSARGFRCELETFHSETVDVLDPCLYVLPAHVEPERLLKVVTLDFYEWHVRRVTTPGSAIKRTAHRRSKPEHSIHTQTLDKPNKNRHSFTGYFPSAHLVTK